MSLESKIKDIIGINKYNVSKENVVIGIEFENEIKQIKNFQAIPGWSFQKEFSLRYNGFEYALETPKPYHTLCTEISKFFEVLNLLISPYPLTNSGRTSTHVHFNVSQYTYLEMATFSVLYWILEDLLIDFCGEGRKGNHFALRSLDTMFPQKALAYEIQNNNPFISNLFSQGSQSLRYSSLNLNSVTKFGSLEFRLMRGVSEADSAITWVTALNEIRLFALKHDLKSLQKYLIDTDAPSVVSDVFTPKTRNDAGIHVYSSKERSDKIHEGMSRVLCVFAAYNYMVKNKPKNKTQHKIETSIKFKNTLTNQFDGSIFHITPTTPT